MNKEVENDLVPRLRFSSYLNEGNWENNTLAELASFRRGSFPQPYGLPEWYDNENGFPFVQVYDVADNFKLKPKTKNIISSLAAAQSVFIKEGTLIITIQGSIGRVAITQYDAYIDRTLLIFKEFFKPIDKIFMSYSLFLLFEIEKQKAPGGIIKTITKEVLSSFTLLYPSLPEQKKIASCLSSLDELIQAETDRLAALQAHKKGMLQQLFPAEGETVPQLRFPEFQENGDWEEKELGELGHSISGLTYSPNDVREEGLLVLRSSNIQNGNMSFEDNVYVDFEIRKANISKLNDILICVRNGSKSLIGKNAIIPEGMPKCTHGAFMNVFRAKHPKFVFQLFQTDLYYNQISQDLGATINSINNGKFKKYKFPVPPSEAEQQKISDCLSSLDNQLTTLSEQIEALKIHKKGLLQGLFPQVTD